jgi:type VI secretion system secreted protein VgrG
MYDLPADTARFTLKIASFAHELRVVGFKGTEQLSQPFEFELELASQDPQIGFEKVINQPALLTLFGRDAPRYVHAMVSGFKQGGQGDRFTTYHASLVPRVWYLGHRHNCRIFQHLEVKQIIEQVLKDAGFTDDDYRFVLQQSYPVLEYCVQYRESELNFISRLMEEAGISFFFEHQANNHVLVMCDGEAAQQPIAGSEQVIYHRASGAVTSEEHIFHYRYTLDACPGPSVYSTNVYQSYVKSACVGFVTPPTLSLI